MLAQWEAQNIYTGIGTLALTDTVPVDAKHVEAVKALLAVKIAPLFGIAVPIDVKKMSMTGWQLLKGDFFDTEELRGDDGLSFMPSQRRYW